MFNSTAKITVIETVDEIREYEQGGLRWDDMPTYKRVKAWIVKLNIIGKYDWTYSRKVNYPSLRKILEKTTTGTAIVNLIEYMLMHNEKDLDGMVLRIINKLQKRGFEVDLLFDKNYNRQNLSTTLEVLAGHMPKRKDGISSRDLYP